MNAKKGRPGNKANSACLHKRAVSYCSLVDFYRVLLLLVLTHLPTCFFDPVREEGGHDVSQMGLLKKIIIANYVANKRLLNELSRNRVCLGHTDATETS